MPTVADIMAWLQQFAPLHLAASWDNVGLLLGRETTPVRRLLTCLTVTPAVVAEAVDEQVQCIVSHHPILFRAVQRLSSQTAEGQLLLPLLEAGIAVYSPHTAFDNTVGGINDWLAQRLSLTGITPLRRQEGPRQVKLVVFVPDKDLARVSDALFAAGAGVIGQYRECSYRLSGVGTFFGTEHSHPTLGQKGRREEVSEWRLEVVCPEASLTAVVAAMRQAHSYEEPAFDIYPLKAAPSSVGDGRVGRLPAPMTLEQLVQQVKMLLSATSVQWVGEVQRTVERVAIVCGAGGELLKDAGRVRADVFLTGEMRFHDYLAAEAQGLAVVLPGHYATERPGVEMLADRLQQQWATLTVWASRRERDPVHG